MYEIFFEVLDPIGSLKERVDGICMENLSFKPIRQEAWYLQIRDKILHSKRPTDKMSIAEVLQMYRERKFVCDTCGKELYRAEFSLEDHICHLINPVVLWSCEECILSDIKDGRTIATTENF
jgi:hypothetical protein